MWARSSGSGNGVARSPTSAAAFAVLAVVLTTCNAGPRGANVNPDDTAVASTPTATIQQPNLDRVFEVSLIALIATPERYANTYVRVRGYAVFEFEGEALYLHREDYEQGRTKNGLSLKFPDGARMRTPSHPASAIVEGTFDPTSHGHMSAFSGSIVDVRRVEETPSMEDVRRILDQSLDASK